MDKKFENELKAVSKRIMILTKSVEKMIVMVGKLEKPKAAKKPKAKVVKKKPVKKTVTKKPTKTAVGTILGVIKGSKKGVDTATLMKKTGFNAKKIQNNIFKLKKQGKIKSEGKGVYLSA